MGRFEKEPPKAVNVDVWIFQKDKKTERGITAISAEEFVKLFGFAPNNEIYGLTLSITDVIK